MSFFANLFGYVLNFLYIIVKNYGLAIILFSILVKAIMIPITLKQQKTLKKNEKLQKEMKQIQFKYKNDPEKMNQELMSLYKREGMSPFSGCLSSIIQLILLFSVFLLVRSPLTYMVKMDKDVINNMQSIVNEQDPNTKNAYAEIAIIQYVRNLENTDSVSEEQVQNENKDNKDEAESKEQNSSRSETESKEEDNSNNETENKEEEKQEEKFNIQDYAEQANINMDFFGIDLSQVPTKNLTDWKTLVIPVLYVITSFISIRLTTNTTKKKQENLLTDGEEENKEKEEEYNPMEDANKTMMWMMPIMSISIAIIAPLGLALYWLMNNILMIIERIVFNNILKKEEEAEKDA